MTLVGGKDSGRDRQQVRKHLLRTEQLRREQPAWSHVRARLDTKILDSMGYGEVTGRPSWAFLLGGG